MSKTETAAIILAAGKGTRMKSAQHKVLHRIGGRPMLDHVFATLDELGATHRVLVVGDKREQLADYGDRATLVVQEPQLGTGHAVAAARGALAGFSGTILILYGDVPLVRAATLHAMMEQLEAGDGKRALIVLGFDARDPGRYGRLVTAGDSELQAIVEFKDATSSERALTLCNSGIMAVRAPLLFELLDEVDSENAAGEYYLTDIVAGAARRGLASGVAMADELEVMGVNARDELATLERVYQDHRRSEAMIAGATLVDPQTVYFSYDTVIGRDVVVEPNVFFGPGVTVADNVTIHAFSHLAGCQIAIGASVGPFARLRPGADVGPKAKVGNFVEIKKAVLGEGAKVSHLTYLGDADIGAGANIGAGTITCNYDGFLKYRTEIGAGAFIGSNTALVAPVHVGDGAIVGAGSVIVKDVAADDLAVARGEQTSRPGWAKKFRAKMVERKAKQAKKDG